MASKDTKWGVGLTLAQGLRELPAVQDFIARYPGALKFEMLWLTLLVALDMKRQLERGSIVRAIGVALFCNSHVVPNDSGSIKSRR